MDRLGMVRKPKGSLTMPARNAELRRAAAKAGYAAVKGDPDRIVLTRRDLAAERLAAYIEKIVAEAPPLTEAQQRRLASLLRPSAQEVSAG